MIIENYQRFYPMKDPKSGILEVDIVKEEYHKDVCNFIDCEGLKIYVNLTAGDSGEKADIIYSETIIPDFKKLWYSNLFRYDCTREKYFVKTLINGKSELIGKFIINHDNVYARLLKECDSTKIYSGSSEVYNIDYYYLTEFIKTHGS